MTETTLSSFFDSNICKNEQFCNICRSLEQGRRWREFQVKRFPELQIVDYECPLRPWGYKNAALQQPPNRPPPPMQPQPPPQPPIPDMAPEKWLELKEILIKNNDDDGVIQWKVVEKYEHNPNKHGCQCRKWKQELLDYARRKGYCS